MNLTEARRTARAVLDAPRTENTAAQYERRGRTVLAQLSEAGLEATAAGVHRLAVDRGWSVGTYNQSRTALAYTLAIGVIEHARLYNRDRRKGRAADAGDARRKAVSGAAALESIRQPPPQNLSSSKRTRSPRRGLSAAQVHAAGRGAGDWRMDLAAAMRDDSDRAAATVMAATGCRPQELAAGVDLDRDRHGQIRALIRGAKVNARRGQKTRTLTLDTDTDTGRALAARIDAAGGEWRCSLSASDGPNAFRQRIAARAAALGYSTVSAYSFRHQFASDTKAGGLEPHQVAAALGHATDKAPTAYGQRQLGTGNTGILTVDTARPVRRLGKLKPWHDPAPMGPRL
jgi:integrase